MSTPTTVRALVALVLFSLAGCRPSRAEAPPRPESTFRTAAASCSPAPPPVLECPSSPVLECPALEPAPGPVELEIEMTAVEPLGAELQAEWDVRGCNPSGVELLGEAGQIVSTYGRESVPVVNVTRPGPPMIQRLGLWARVTCDDGRSQVAGPFIVQDVIRASQVTLLELDPGHTVEHLTALPNGGWAVMTGRAASNDPTVTTNQLCVFKPDGKPVGFCEGLRQRVTGEPRADHPWLEGTRVVAAPVPGTLRAWIDYGTGERRSAYVDRTPLPPEATSVPERPAGLRAWGGTWAPAVGDSGRAWVERGGTVALVDL